ncbi:MAG TPA: hypothetical protein VML94_03330 [Thermoplasmata archaeon]|nr:hypothetical protein [Thermoplasmata archaeon]
MSLLIVGTLALGFAPVGVGAAAPAHAAAHAAPSVTPSVQRAFGGSVSATWSCMYGGCFANDTNVGNLTLSLQYSVTWAVIYTVTNVSGSQTEVQIQAALGASASIAISTCTNGTGTIPCQTTSFAVSLKGSEVFNGYTNLTSGSVNQTNASAGPLGSTAAWAIMNSWSKASLNFSGSFSATIPLSDVRSESVSASFDVGGSSTSSINFPSPLAVVPVDPVAGDMWQSSAPYTASGSYSNGSTLTLNEPDSAPMTVSHWYHGSVTPSGTLALNGTDVGPVTLYDNYTAPPTMVTAQVIDLTFSSGNYSAEDGWLVVPLNLFGGVGGLLSQTAVQQTGPSPAVGAHTAATDLNGSSESAYYRDGPGIIGVGATGNSTLPVGEPGAETPTIKVQAGPEPVSVAQDQYNSIVSPGSSGNGFPLLLVLVAAVVVVVAIGGVFVWRRSAGRNRPPSPPPPPTGMNPGGPGPGQ